MITAEAYAGRFKDCYVIAECDRARIEAALTAPSSALSDQQSRCKNCGATSPSTTCDATGFACEMQKVG